MERFVGDDTTTRVTILDEDFPGNLGFEDNQITVSRTNTHAELVIKRVEGSDGKISCLISTLQHEGTQGLELKIAQEHEDYMPVKQRVYFDNGET